MFRWTPYVFIRFTIFLLAGILLYRAFPGIHLLVVVSVFSVSFVGYLVLWLIQQRRKVRMSLWFGLLAFVVTSAFGWLCTYEQTDTNHPNHISHLSEVTYYTGKVVAEVQSKAKNYRTVVEIEQVVSDKKLIPATGKVLIYTPKDAPVPLYGDKLIIYGTPLPVQPPPNPDEFDYKKYLALQQIYYQQFVKKGKFLVYEHTEGNAVISASLRGRAWADQIFRKYITAENEYAIISGLVLGLRSGLDDELKGAYAAAGAMHILAVSGAHVIVIFELILLVVGRIKKVRYGNWFFAVVALLLLWFYAFITGLSASVLRSVVMFSLVVLGEALRREGTLFNTLGFSAFILLCYDPYLLQDVGFQLSYLAVAGIIYLYPRIYAWAEFETTWLDKLWKLVCGSIAAQIAVLPLSLFYFHQFPTYFLIANLLMIPLSGVLLYGGLALLAVAWIPYVSDAIGFLLKWLTWLMNQIAFWTEHIPGALMHGSYLELWELGVIYILLFLVLWFLYIPKLRVWSVICVLMLCLITSQLYNNINYAKQHFLAVYVIPGHSALDVVDHHQHVFVADSALSQNKSQISYHLQNHWTRRQILDVRSMIFSNVDSTLLAIHQNKQFSLFTWHGKRFCILHQPVNLQLFQKQKFDYLIIQNNSLKNIKKFPAQSFTTVILDASNRYYLSKRLSNELRMQKIICHNVHEQGAFTLTL
ncbi:ComEC/Rec2 family competence protein [Cytophagaceae bacterium DM2B3-1]|uniref:ComEC/Rec2 family competence protein n=1 Tax=Xanthocytophaga flava TaxID=3048013 RepID=A0ABT7CV72_9BACT|nr:ComEC/Rec2 family competence protein [Xanthocytophaga flavus]MDJ1497561.1 ComEC/Rec2 family competence protein [Xanthocytophaga flavus]